MNEFSSTKNSEGLLKVVYENTPLGEALKKKREKMATNRGIDLNKQDHEKLTDEAKEEE
jgi:hypothetical protein